MCLYNSLVAATAKWFGSLRITGHSFPTAPSTGYLQMQVKRRQKPLKIFGVSLCAVGVNGQCALLNYLRLAPKRSNVAQRLAARPMVHHQAADWVEVCGGMLKLLHLGRRQKHGELAVGREKLVRKRHDVLKS